jgi:hypothetical protein
MNDYTPLIDRIIDKIECVFFRLSLHRREKQIRKDFDRRLSQEIDCLLTLLED